jgi:beta-glucanase (GH16 family)
MKRVIFISVCFLAASYGCKQPSKLHSAADAGNLYTSEGYTLVWSDEFNKPGPDTANWRYENGFVRNEEFQWYQTENAFCDKGLLVIEGRRERKLNPNYQAGSADWKRKRQFIEYTASSINTSRKHTWQYGRFVMRGRIDVSAGLWPAWWTLGVSGRWPSNGEIDIMEYYRNKLLFNVACGTATPFKAEWFSKTYNVDSLGGKTWADKFHIWRMDWDENAIALYLDDKLMNRVELSKLVNKDGSNVNPFKQPHYMLLNLAIGGMNGGDPAGTNFPTKFEVDYVRVYQKK